VDPVESGNPLLNIFKNAYIIKEEEESDKDENYLDPPPPPDPDPDQEEECEGKPRKN
jgi:hypothetical protein